MKRIIFSALGILMMVSVWGQTLEAAKTELFNTNDTVARDMFLELLKTDTANKVTIEYYLGVLHSYLQEDDMASLYLKKVVDAEPQSPLAYIAGGRIDLMMGDTIGAITKFKEALNIAEDNKAFIYLEVGNAYVNFTPYYLEAIRILKTALSFDTTNSLCMLLLASVYAQQGDEVHNALYLANNLELLKKARRQNNKLTVTWLREGGCLIELADFDMQEIRGNDIAFTKILQAINNDPLQHDELTALKAMPDSTIQNLLLDSAIASLNKATTMSSVKLSNAWLLLGNAKYKRHHNPAEVIQIYETAKILRGDKYYDACFNLGVVYNELNDAEHAIENLLRAFDLNPYRAETPYLLATSFSKLNRVEQVTYWLQKGFELRKPKGSDYYSVGTGFGKIGHNLDKAIQYLEKAIALEPNTELYCEDLGVAYGLNGQYGKAIETAGKLVALNPNYAPAYINLAASYRNKGNNKKADYYQSIYDKLIGGTKN